MYELMLLLHSYTRWLVIIVMGIATTLAWWGWLSKRPWSEWDRLVGITFAWLFTLQFLLGAILYFLPDGLVQIAWQDIEAAMKIRDLRFFSVEHGFQMLIALGITHMGQARSRKAEHHHIKFRWAAGAYTIATILILTAIPWWRPFFRPVNLSSTGIEPMQILTDLEGNPERGSLIFTQSLNGQTACSTCHTLDNLRLVGPGLGGVAERAGGRVAGQSAEVYLYTSIVSPVSYVVEGFPNIMPTTYEASLDDQDLADLVAYLLTLR